MDAVERAILEAESLNGLQMPQTISAWSHSRLTTFEKCKLWAKLAYVDKIPEPPRPLPPGKTEHANDRGTRVHLGGEKYVQGGVELIEELKHYGPEFSQLRDMYAAGRVSLEGEWAFDRKWQPVAWKSSTAWCRIKCDAVAFLSSTEAVVIDYKTGKRWGNEVKHHEQMQLYQLAVFLKYPKVKTVHVELWYTDLDYTHRASFRRDQGLRFLDNFERKGVAITTCEDFEPNPSVFTCKWCPYKPQELGGTGHCSVGV